MAKGWWKRRLGIRTKRFKSKVLNELRANKRVLATKQYVDSRVDNTTEKKFIAISNVNASASIANATPFLGLINGLVQGVTDNTRLGDRCRAKFLEMKILVTIPLQAGGQATTYTYSLFWYKNLRGVAPTLTQFYNVATPSATELFNHVNIDFSSRFQVLRHGSFTANMSAATVAREHLIHLRVPLRDKVVDYSIGNAGSIADIDENALYFEIHSDTNAVSTVYWSYYYFYMDM